MSREVDPWRAREGGRDEHFEVLLRLLENDREPCELLEVLEVAHGFFSLRGAAMGRGLR